MVSRCFQRPSASCRENLWCHSHSEGEPPGCEQPGLRTAQDMVWRQGQTNAGCVAEMRDCRGCIIGGRAGAGLEGAPLPSGLSSWRGSGEVWWEEGERDKVFLHLCVMGDSF